MHAGLISAVSMSYASSTSLELKSLDNSQHRLTCIDIGQTDNVLCGLTHDVKGVNSNDYNIATRGHSGNPLPKGSAHYWVSRIDRCRFDSVHAGLTSAVLLSFAGSTSLI